jgi:hypothetical protein
METEQTEYAFAVCCKLEAHDQRSLRRREFVKLKSLLLCISFACAPTVNAFGQLNCNTSNKLVCQFPVSAQVLASNVVGGYQNGNNPAYTEAFNAALKAAGPINESIAAQLTQLPIPSATVGVVSLRRKGHEGGIPFDNLGPILTDRPDTVGKGHLFFGFSYQHFNFNAVDGVDLAALPVGFNFKQNVTTDGNAYRQFYGSGISDVGFQLNQFVALLTYGITRTTDLSVIVPINDVSLKVTSSGFKAYLYDSAKNAYANVTPAQGNVVTSGSASGIGDVGLNLKHMIFGQEGERPAMALGATFRFPSGDSYNYLGSGALGGSIYSLLEYRATIAPHAKIGYQWNDASKVLNLNGPPARLPGGLQYDIGADVRLLQHLTAAVDVLGNQIVNVGSFNIANTSLTGVGLGANGAGGAVNVSSVNAFRTTYTTANFSGGLKWSPMAHLLLYGNVLVQMNNVGLRSDPVPLFGIAYNFKKQSKAD